MELAIEEQVTREEVLTRDWVRIYRDEAKFPDSDKLMERIVLSHTGAACILALTADDKVVLVEQYRYAAQETLYEIPAGKNDTWQAGAEETARRELAEETPYTSGKLEFICDFYVAPGYSDELISLYKATDLMKDSTLTLDEDESLRVQLVSKDEARKMLQTGKIRDAKTIIALQYWLCLDE